MEARLIYSAPSVRISGEKHVKRVKVIDVVSIMVHG